MPTSITANIRADSLRRAKLEPGQRELLIRDDKLAGFGLRVFASGKASYIFNGRLDGKRRQVLIGDAHAMSAADARTRAEELRLSFQRGTDPIAEERAHRAAEEAARYPLKSAADRYLDLFELGQVGDQKRAPRPASITSEKKDLDRVVEMLGADKPVSEISIDAVVAFKDGLSRFAPTSRKKMFGVLRRTLDRAVTDKRLAANPALAVKAPRPSDERDRVLDSAELKAIWEACDGLGAYGQAVKFLITMPLRVSIVRTMTADQIDDGILFVGAEQEGNKARRSWRLPIPSIGLDVLADQSEEGLVFRGGRGGMVAFSSQAKAKLDKESGVAGWVLHDLRTSVVTLLADAVPDLDVDAADLWLMHKRTGIKGKYQRSDRPAAQAQVATHWDRVLRSILADNVVELRA